MKRYNFFIDPETIRALKARAKLAQTKPATLIRQAINNLLASPPPRPEELKGSDPLPGSTGSPGAPKVLSRWLCPECSRVNFSLSCLCGHQKP